MDDADTVTEREERFAPHMIEASKKPSGPPAVGYCLYCGEMFSDARRWCDGDHRDAWEKEQKR